MTSTTHLLCRPDVELGLSRQDPIVFTSVRRGNLRSTKVSYYLRDTIHRGSGENVRLSRSLPLVCLGFNRAANHSTL